jgi:hypothetical protein
LFDSYIHRYNQLVGYSHHSLFSKFEQALPEALVGGLAG